MEFLGISLITRDVPALAEFYKNVLDVDADGNDTHVELKTEGAALAIFSAAGMESMAPESMRGAGCGSVTIGFRVKDVDAEYERLERLGVRFVKLPTTHPWGYRSLWFRDPDNNIVDFMSPANGHT
jgi:catechol 2,3-dioxygenase-like lactoylglutathione lyase family enzyme